MNGEVNNLHENHSKCWMKVHGSTKAQIDFYIYLQLTAGHHNILCRNTASNTLLVLVLLQKPQECYMQLKNSSADNFPVYLILML